ncbi:hypothetical protein PAXINDRAFT_166459 [Paxillus involutus ATCC 200175]|nr:hypothetical protein PAXINDRAFT_166459 [Paxillus involutus ATCC 200175]
MSSQIQPSSQPSANPDTPPPAYSIRVPNLQQGPPSSQHSPASTMPGYFPNRAQSLFSSSSGPHFAPPPHFGPTPLMQSQPTLGLLPYYDPRSPYAIEAATSRARWRFIRASLWAVCLIGCLLLVAGYGGLRDI